MKVVNRGKETILCSGTRVCTCNLNTAGVKSQCRHLFDSFAEKEWDGDEGKRQANELENLIRCDGEDCVR